MWLPFLGAQHGRRLRQAPAEHHRRIVQAALLAVLASLSIAAAGCGGTGSSGRPNELARARAKTRCPSAPSLDPRTASAASLVPDDPKLALICRYVPPPVRRPGGFSHAGDRWATDSSRVRLLAHLLDQLPPIGKIATSCPESGGGRTDLIVFVYPARQPTRVRIERRACIPVTNGRVVRYGLGLPFREPSHWPDEGLI